MSCPLQSSDPSIREDGFARKTLLTDVSKKGSAEHEERRSTERLKLCYKRPNNFQRVTQMIRPIVASDTFGMPTMCFAGFLGLAKKRSRSNKNWGHSCKTRSSSNYLQKRL